MKFFGFWGKKIPIFFNLFIIDMQFYIGDIWKLE